MRIRSLSTYAVAPRWLFLRVRTDEGIDGWGVDDQWRVLMRGGFSCGGR
jgi:hypothetical protein